MKTKRDCYEILGLSKNATANEIKKAYRKLAKKYHPDTNAGNAQAEERFKAVTEAYGILSDEEKKRLYDQFGYAAFDGSNPGAEGQNTRQGGYREYHFTGEDMGDIFQDIFGNEFHGDASFGGPFTDGFGRGGFSRRGADLHADVTITFDEAAFGCKKIFRLQDEHSGQPQNLQVRIPAGIASGKYVRLKGKGYPGTRGGQPGDLLLKVQVQDKPGFERKGMDVYTTVKVPFTTAVLGGEVPVSTIYGNVLCKIREGTQSGTKIRLRGKGIVSMKDSSVHGDQYTTVEIQVPRNISREARQKLKEFEQACKGKGSGSGSAA